ncbi:hypothetical protein Ping_0154 [Psychromonas ingrahamii 37]|uniref:Uncharacterized protein n=2 Tax=Psychromonas ingrahamii TaxID=357794 RepID=A1SRA7_PSYIN|nr:hypothetical protein Ping_0154 [Psychromonas ingrahamii 37]
MDDTTRSDENDIKSQQIITEWNNNQGVIRPLFIPESTQFTIPAMRKNVAKTVRLSDINCKYKKLIFSALYTAFYIIYFTDREAISNRVIYRRTVVSFIEYLNERTITKNNRTRIFKDYEEFRVKKMGVKPQSTGLKSIRKFIYFSIAYEPFSNLLSAEQYKYLGVLNKTKAAPSEKQESYTLTDWFSFHSWLRRDDIGIGNELFNRLASPKALSLSLRITAEVALYSIQQAKYALIEFFKENNITTHQILIPMPAPKKADFSAEEFKDKRKRWLCYIYPHITEQLAYLQKTYKKSPCQNKYLGIAFEIILHSWCKSNSIGDSLARFHKEQYVERFIVDKDKRNTDRFSITESWLFSHQFLYAISEYAHSEKKGILPVCKAEHLLFQWLMAYQSVQPSDIAKLKLSDFNFLKRRNGIITHISSSYFKGRSQATHYLKDIKANSTMGKAVLSFINDNTANRKIDLGALTTSYNDGGMTTYQQGLLAPLISLLATSTINLDINHALQKHNTTSVFIEAFNLIIRSGVDYEKYRVDQSRKSSTTTEASREKWQERCETYCNKNIFGLSAIKNSAIHARSDSFSPTMMQNYNSHSNETEQKNYRTEASLQWLNSCGRVTRAVMQDMYINVFSPSKAQIQSYNSEFTQAAELINSHKTDLLNRIKTITGQKSGRVDELGFIESNKVHHTELADVILLVDAPETVMKFYHYEAEVSKKYKSLASKSPEFLLFTVLPMAEYVSTLLHEKKFSMESMKKGKALYLKYAAHLPPHFTSHLGM